MAKRKRPEDYQTVAEAAGIIWCGPIPKDVLTNTVWKCSGGYEWFAPYHGVSRGRGCPHCAGLAVKSAADYALLAKNRGFEWLGPLVVNSKSDTSWRCSEEHVWRATYNNVSKGSNCPTCSNHVSRPEIQLREAVTQVYLDTQGNVRKLLKNRSFELDIYVPSLKKAIEYDGWAHTHYPEAQERDARKERECAEAGIDLLRVTDKEYKANPEATTQRVLEWLKAA